MAYSSHRPRRPELQSARSTISQVPTMTSAMPESRNHRLSVSPSRTIAKSTVSTMPDLSTAATLLTSPSCSARK